MKKIEQENFLSIRPGLRAPVDIFTLFEYQTGVTNIVMLVLPTSRTAPHKFILSSS